MTGSVEDTLTGAGAARRRSSRTKYSLPATPWTPGATPVNTDDHAASVEDGSTESTVSSRCACASSPRIAPPSSAASSGISPRASKP